MAGNVVALFDGLKDFVTGLGGPRDRTVTQTYAALRTLSLEEIETMYRSDWLAGKIVDIIPQDMVREGRAWQAPNAEITQLEELEHSRPVNLWPKMYEALVRSRLLGGACIFIGMREQSPSVPLEVEKTKKGDLAYLNVLDRSLLSWEEIDLDPQSLWYGEPKMWLVSNGQGGSLRIHPSRMIHLDGKPVYTRPASLTPESGVWGDPVLQRVYEAVKNAASVQQHVAGLVPDSRNDVIYIPGLGDILKNPVEQKKLTERFGYARTMKSMFNMLLLEGNGVTGAGGRGETWNQRQVSFAELPELIRQYLQISAGAADIPVTRLLNESPSGQNATGESDLRNYYDHVRSLQNLVLGPKMLDLNQIIIMSALGTRDGKIFARWNSLWSLSPTEQAIVFKDKALGARAIQGTGKDIPLINAMALSDALVTSFTEEGSLPGLEAAVEKHGAMSTILEKDDLKPKPEPTPVVAANSNEPGATPKKVASGDAEPRPMYVYRKLLNTSEFVKWASDQGIRDIVASDDLHVTIMRSEKPVDWMKMGADMWSGDKGKITVPAGGPRVVEPLGPNATVLLFSSNLMSWRHYNMREAGAEHTFDEFVIHLTISMSPQVIDLSKVKAFQGELRFGPEIFEEARLDL